MFELKYRHFILVLLVSLAIPWIFSYLKALSRTSRYHRFYTPVSERFLGPFTKDQLAAYIGLDVGFIISFSAVYFIPRIFGNIGLQVSKIIATSVFIFPIVLSFAAGHYVSKKNK